MRPSSNLHERLITPYKQNTIENYSTSKQTHVNSLGPDQTNDPKQQFYFRKHTKRFQWANLVQTLNKAPENHSHNAMLSAGFKYTDEGDIAHCPTCGLEISGLKSDIKPFTIHRERSPSCPFVLSMIPPSKIITPTVNKSVSLSSALVSEEHSAKRMKTDTAVEYSELKILTEMESLKQVRKRGFSSWPHQASPSASQMIDAGFFNCNVGDRVICIYCNLICQQWTPNSDDPCEVHKTLSSKCPYIISMLIISSTSPISIINEASGSVDPIRSQAIVHTAACHPQFSEIPKRNASFATWPNENLPSVDDLVRAGFFFTGTKTVVTCFYCNGSLQNWGANDNPMIEHARWFPHCAYAKQLCGVEMHRKIQESKRAQQERTRLNDASNQTRTSGSNPSQTRPLIPDESTLSRFVAARLDLPISQSLLDRKFKLSIIKRCWEDQLRLKQDDFVSDADLVMACTVLQKQIEYIDGRKDRIIIPSVAMRKIREQGETEVRAHEHAASRPSATDSSERTEMELTTASSTESNTSESNSEAATNIIEDLRKAESASSKASVQKSSDDTSPANPCVLCLTEEKRLACIPCGHLAACVPCAHSLRSCPICRREIEAFVRIYF